MSTRFGIDRSTAPLLVAEGLVKRYGGLTALAGVDLAIRAGELVGLVGPNGSGKTTLFDCLTGMTVLDEGRVSYEGADITRARPHRIGRLGIARTFQRIRVYEAMTTLDNVMLSRAWSDNELPGVLGRPSGETTERATELLALLGIAEQRNELAGSLSWGQQRLLELAMVLMPDPELILLDEATSGVNPGLIHVIKERIHSLNREDRKTILMIEHNVEVIADLCERVIVLDHGVKIADGPVDAVFRDPTVVEAYLGREEIVE